MCAACETFSFIATISPTVVVVFSMRLHKKPVHFRPRALRSHLFVVLFMQITCYEISCKCVAPFASVGEQWEIIWTIVRGLHIINISLRWLFVIGANVLTLVLSPLIVMKYAARLYEARLLNNAHIIHIGRYCLPLHLVLPVCIRWFPSHWEARKKTKKRNANDVRFPSSGCSAIYRHLPPTFGGRWHYRQRTTTWLWWNVEEAEVTNQKQNTK